MEDIPADVVMINHELRRAGLHFRAKRVETKEEFQYQLQHHVPDLIVSDHGLPRFDGFAVLAMAKATCPDVPFIFVTGSRGEEVVIETFEHGATDYVLKSNLGKLVPAIQRALRDVSERAELKQAEERHEHLAAIVEGAGDAIFSASLDGVIRGWNPAAVRLLGYTPAEIIGQPALKLVPPDRLEEESRILARIQQGDPAASFETRRRRKDGSWVDLAVTLSPIRDASGQVTGVSQIVREITGPGKSDEQLRRLNQELEERIRQQTELLEAANHELEAFSYSVSHDLRAPLRHVLGYVDIVQGEAVDLDDESRKNLATVADAAKQMSQLMDALLEFSRLGRAEMQFERVNLGALVREARRELQGEIKGRDIDWQIGPLPEVSGDRMMLRQVLVNLLSNAVKFTLDRERARIEVGARLETGEVVCFVRDNGVGFSMDYVSKLFGVFQRLHAPTEFEGTGIGLAKVRRIIHRHGGRAWADGAVDKGATLYFSVPSPSQEAAT